MIDKVVSVPVKDISASDEPMNADKVKAFLEMSKMGATINLSATQWQFILEAAIRGLQSSEGQK